MASQEKLELQFCIVLQKLPIHHDAWHVYMDVVPCSLYFSAHGDYLPVVMLLLRPGNGVKTAFVSFLCLLHDNIRGSEPHLKCIFSFVLLSWSGLLPLGPR